MGQLAYLVSIAISACLWTLIAAGCIAILVYPDDPEAIQGWGLTWLLSLPFVGAFSVLAGLSHPAYLDTDSELLRFLLYLSMVITVGLLTPFGWAVFTRLLGLSGAP